jgi:hypothetical protein
LEALPPSKWPKRIVTTVPLCPSSFHPSSTSSHGRQQPANAMTGFAPHANWVELKHHQERVAEPNQEHRNLVGPTVLTRQAKAPKYN